MSSEEKQQGAGFVDLRLLVRSGWKLIKRFWWQFGVLAVVFFALVMLLWHQVYTPTYKSYCSFTVKVINDSTTGQINTLYGFYYDKDLAEQLEKTFTYILTSDLLSDEIREQLGENVAAGNVQAECVTGSNLFVLSTFGATPEESARYLMHYLRRDRGEERYQGYLENILNGCIEPPGLDEGCVDPIDGQIRCRAGNASFWITWDGWLTPCGMMPEPKIDVTRDSFPACWKALTEASAAVRVSGVCDKCPNKGVCHPCAAIAYTETGSTAGIPTYMCHSTQKMRQIAQAEFQSEEKT